MNSLTQYIELFDAHRATIDAHAPELLNARRPAAREALDTLRLPRRGDEGYPALSVEEMFAPDFGLNISRLEMPAGVADTFRCGVPNVSTLLAVVAGDSFEASPTLERNLPDGVEVMSLARAADKHPAEVGQWLGSVADEKGNAAVALNSLLLQDGVYIRVRRGVRLDKPIQIVNIFNTTAPMMAVRRILVVLEEGAAASLLVCDHTRTPGVAFLSNQVVELVLQGDSSLCYYEMEESSAATARLSNLYARQDSGSKLTVNGSTLLGGVTRNDYHVDCPGTATETRLGGMVVASGSQVVDNATYVAHHAERGTSDQMFKYVLNDSSVGSFYGTIVVDETARFTKAYQSNRNILADAAARMYTRPQLEIYCDEVKCSHGATIGQLDARALFYMQSRGIPQPQARLMLMQAFMADVIDTVGIPALRTRLQQLIDRRLSGETILCHDCSNPSALQQ